MKSFDNSNSFNNISLFFSKCDIKKHLNFYNQNFAADFDANSYNCLEFKDYSPNNPILKTRNSFSSFNTYISFMIKICSSNSSSCMLPDNNTLNKISNSKLKFMFGYLESNMDIKKVSREAPIYRIPNFFSQIISSSNKYHWDFNLIKKRYSTDFGYLLTDIHDYELFSIEKNVKVSSNSRLESNYTDPEVLSFTLGVKDFFRPVYYRTFYKGQNFFAEIGGVFNFLFVIAYHLNLLYSAVNFNLAIDNKCKISYYTEKVKIIKFSLKILKTIFENFRKILN